MYNRLTWPKAMCQFLTNTGSEVILIDNNSTYQPLLDWYDDCPYKVYRLSENLGHLALWKSGLIDSFDDRYFILTDPDLDLSGVPHDYADFLLKGLENNPNVVKSGLSLRIDDLPNNPFAKQAYEWEKKFWQGRRDGLGFINASIDSTFAVYDRERTWGDFPGGSPSNDKFFSAVRAPKPYTAKHCPWYLTKEDLETNEEEKFYSSVTNTYWNQKMKEAFKI